MKKITVIFLLAAMLVSSFTVFAQSAQIDPVVSGSNSLHAQVPLGGSEKRLDTAKAAILYELNTDTLIYCWNPDTRINPTGLVKFLTVLIALEQGDLDEIVTVKRSVVDVGELIGSVSAGLKFGEEISLRDLICCVMVSSANDAAAVIADHIGGEGGKAAFLEMMNEKAKQLGCTNSYFTNVHGLAAPEQYSTARDLAIITEAALENEIFAELFSLERYTVPATNKSEARELKTTNYMMSAATVKNYIDPRVTGGKPAAATSTDRSMICTAEVGTASYLCVVMSAAAQVSQDGLSVTNFGNFVETKALIDYGEANFVVRQVIDQRQIFSQYAVSGGENDVVLQPSQDVYTVLPKGYDVQNLEFIERVEADRLQAPLKKGDVLGSVSIRYGSIVLGTCDLLAMYDVAPEGSSICPVDRIEPETEVEQEYWFLLKWALILLGSLLALAILVLLIIRLIHSARIRRAHRRRMRQRRRSR